LQRYKDATISEFNYAVAGYWRNWERFAALPMREISYTQIAGNPYIKNKPHSSREFIKLSIDEVRERTEAPTPEEIERVRKEVFDGKKV
jgi:hypothetical protein